jgi:hypothetical protein
MYALQEDIAASRDSYERFAADIERSLPNGLILHAAGRTDEGVRIIEIWEGEEAWRASSTFVRARRPPLGCAGARRGKSQRNRRASPDASSSSQLVARSFGVHTSTSFTEKEEER